VNLVNAHLVARDRGVDVKVTHDKDAAGYSSLLAVSIRSDRGRKVIAGTVFDGHPRIVQLRDVHVDFAPEGYILVLAYEDRPGMVGRIGTLLGRHNVNIASMHVGRRTKHGRAIVVLILDENLTPAQVDEVARAVDADFARLVRLD
jgi:D-3-phosphoglycerate dehydrogenase